MKNKKTIYNTYEMKRIDSCAHGALIAAGGDK